MSYQSISRPYVACATCSLVLLLGFTGCGLTGDKGLADKSEPDKIEIALQKAAKETAPQGENPETKPGTALRDNHAANLRLPHEADLDLPPLPLSHFRPASANSNLLKPRETPEQIPAPKTTEETSPILAAFAAPPAPARPVSTNAIPPDPTTVQQRRLPPLPTTTHETKPRKVMKVSTDTFTDVVLNSQVPVVVDFYTDWCVPCKKLAPKLDQFAQQQSGVRVVKVNGDHDKKLRQMFGIKSYPTVLVFQEGKVVGQHIGTQKIQKALGL